MSAHLEAVHDVIRVHLDCRRSPDIRWRRYSLPCRRVTARSPFAQRSSHGIRTVEAHGVPLGARLLYSYPPSLDPGFVEKRYSSRPARLASVLASDIFVEGAIAKRYSCK